MSENLRWVLLCIFGLIPLISGIVIALFFISNSWQNKPSPITPELSWTAILLISFGSILTGCNCFILMTVKLTNCWTSRERRNTPNEIILVPTTTVARDHSLANNQEQTEIELHSLSTENSDSEEEGQV